VCITPVQGSESGVPVLDQFNLILQELIEYRQKGGATILDCQPEGCGRDGTRLQILSKDSKVNLIACTGFHRKKYYPQDHWLWKADAHKIDALLCSELERGLVETLDTPFLVKAGFIKIVLESSWENCFHAGLEGSAAAALKTGALMEIHTEKGALVEKACLYFMDLGLSPDRLVFCHMDKRPDIGLHKELARVGVLLEYDTFYRPKYNPAEHLWPLIDQMVNSGFPDRVALATDMAEPGLYHFIGSGPGLASLPGEIQAKLKEMGFPEIVRHQLLGANIARQLGGEN
jgi:phosphotriesterase-related protein